MIAEDYFSIGEATDAAGGAAPDRQNRNLSAVVSTIRDEGPAAAAVDQPLPDDGPDGTGCEDAAESRVHEIPKTFTRWERAWTMPATDVVAKVAAALLIVICGTVLLVTGGDPEIDNREPLLAEIPAAVAGTAIIRDTRDETVTQRQLQASVLLPDIPGLMPATQESVDTGLAAVETRQQRVMDRLDSLEVAVNTLQSRFERDQTDRLERDIMRRTEQDMQMQDLQTQLAGLQLQLAADGEALQTMAAVEAAQPVTPPPAEGDWVVNVASFSQQAPVRQLQKTLAKKEIVTEIQPVSIKGEFRYRLRVTGFGSRDEARRYAGKLAQEAGLGGAWAGRW